MSNKKSIPDFFIVGAPKCGTTALDYYLSLHPEIFMAPKEMHYFGNDIGMIQDEMSEVKYLQQFKQAEPNQLKGESSVWYLYSSKAADEIKSMNPAAKIIILLRKPTEMIPSLHGQYLYNGIESIKSFEEAFNQDLHRSEKLPCSLFKERPKYLEAALYAKYIEHYLNTFDGKNILILLHDELKQDFQKTFHTTLTFLGVNKTNFTPETAEINKRKTVKSVTLHQMSKTPPKRLRKVFRSLIPFKRLRHAIMKWVEDRNIHEDITQEIANSTKEKLISLTKDDIQVLSKLINRDLSHWTK